MHLTDLPRLPHSLGCSNRSSPQRNAEDAKLRCKTIVHGADSSWTQISYKLRNQLMNSVFFLWMWKIGTNGWLMKVDMPFWSMKRVGDMNLVGLYVAESPYAHTKRCFHVFYLPSNSRPCSCSFWEIDVNFYWLSPCRSKAFRARRLTGAKVPGVRIPSNELRNEVC